MAPLPRVLMITGGYPPAQRAGLERGCQNLSQALARRAHAVTVLTTRSGDLPHDSRDEAGVRVLRVIRPWPVGPLWGVSYMWQVATWMLRLRRDWDFALCHQLYLHSAVAAKLARLTGRRSASLLVAAQDYSDIDRLRRLKGGDRLLKCALSADVLFALSDVSARELRAAGVDEGRVLPYRYFVDSDKFSPAPSGAVGRELLYIGRFDPQKNLPLLVDAFEQVCRTLSDARLRFVGQGPQEADLRRRVAASAARDAIAIDSWTENPTAAYRRACAVVTPSDAEGLSNVLLEAMACGCPVVTTDVSGARDTLGLDDRALQPGEGRVGSGGILVPRRDATALAKALQSLLSDDALRARLSEAARDRAVKTFSEEASVQQFLDGVLCASGFDRTRRTEWA